MLFIGVSGGSGAPIVLNLIRFYFMWAARFCSILLFKAKYLNLKEDKHEKVIVKLCFSILVSSRWCMCGVAVVRTCCATGKSQRLVLRPCVCTKPALPSVELSNWTNRGTARSQQLALSQNVMNWHITTRHSPVSKCTRHSLHSLWPEWCLLQPGMPLASSRSS